MGREVGRFFPGSESLQTVYNIEVEDYHTYYVGHIGVWVHNTNCGEIKSNQQVVDKLANVDAIPSLKDFNGLTPPHNGMGNKWGQTRINMLP